MADNFFSEDGLRDYLKQVGSNRVLEREEEVELFQRLEAGDEAAREEIVRCNLRLVVKIAMQFRGGGVGLADLIQEGNLGLLQVITKFDWRRGFRFSTYAAFWIRQEMQNALRTSGSLIRLPVRKGRLASRIHEAVRHFNSMEGRDPSAEEIAVLVDADAEMVKSLLALREPVLSLDAERADEGTSLLQMVPCHSMPPSHRISEQQTNMAVRGALNCLSDRERAVIELRYGLNEEGSSLSLRKASKIVGLSQEGVRRIEQRALGKLNRPSLRSELEALMTA